MKSDGFFLSMYFVYSFRRSSARLQITWKIFLKKKKFKEIFKWAEKQIEQLFRFFLIF